MNIKRYSGSPDGTPCQLIVDKDEIEIIKELLRWGIRNSVGPRIGMQRTMHEQLDRLWRTINGV